MHASSAVLRPFPAYDYVRVVTVLENAVLQR